MTIPKAFDHNQKNSVLGSLSRHLGHTGSPRQPRVLQVETTNACGLSCEQCARTEQMSREIGYMDKATFTRVAEEVALLQDSIVLHHFGDPVLHPEFAELLAIADSKGLDTFFSTPGSALTDARIEAILDANPHFVTISMDGMSKGSHEAMRVGSEYEQTKERVERFITRRDERGQEYPIVQLQLIETAINADEVADFREYWSGFFSNPTEEPYSDEVLITAFHDWGTVDDEIIDHMAGEDREFLMKSGSKEQTPCWGLWNELVVLWNGDVVPCCFDHDGDLVVGNIREESLEPIFNGKKVRDLREQHLKGEYPDRCQDCPGIQAPSNDQDPFSELDGNYT